MVHIENVPLEVLCSEVWLLEGDRVVKLHTSQYVHLWVNSVLTVLLGGGILLEVVTGNDLEEYVTLTPDPLFSLCLVTTMR